MTFLKLVLIGVLLVLGSFQTPQKPIKSNSKELISTEELIVIEKIKTALNKKDYRFLAKIFRINLKKYPQNQELLSWHSKYIKADFQDNYLPNLKVNLDSAFAKKPNLAKCYSGEVNEKGHQHVLKLLNYTRRLAGIDDSCEFKKELNTKSQSSAFLMFANNNLSHYPPTNWKCFNNIAFEVSGKSNLSLGYGFSEALMGQMEDEGSNNYFCGHRRWILNPKNRVFGHGSTNKSMCLTVIDTDPNYKNNSFNDSQFVAWPAPYHFPKPLIFERWSFSLENADFSMAKVTLKQGKTTIPVSIEKLRIGFAMNTLVWKVNTTLVSNKTYTVQVSNVLVNKKIKSYQYTVIPID